MVAEPSIDIAALQAWVGRSETRCDTICSVPVAGLAATIGREDIEVVQGLPLPPLWHWLYFLSMPSTSLLDADGHPRRGTFLPPVTLPRRMWAASEIEFRAPLLLGDSLQRVSTIAAVEHKKGRSGNLVFVTLEHEIMRGTESAIMEIQRLVYRGPSAAETSKPGVHSVSARPQWSLTVPLDPVLLFRYSALTFNSHRIHYDREYATQQEGYAGLVVQGPLTATLLLDALTRELPHRAVGSFRFRGVRPLLDAGDVVLQGRVDGDRAQLWALDPAGYVVMEAAAELS